jgi:hypothetical protein
MVHIWSNRSYPRIQGVRFQAKGSFLSSDLVPQRYLAGLLLSRWARVARQSLLRGHWYPAGLISGRESDQGIELGTRSRAVIRNGWSRRLPLLIPSAGLLWGSLGKGT